jgi:site-specific recombinase XerC
MMRMKPPFIPEQPVPLVPDELMRKVLDQCKGRDLMSRRDIAIIRLIWDTGARLSEIAALKVDDVDLDIDVIHVVGKGRRPRGIPFSPRTGQALSRYLRIRVTDKWRTTKSSGWPRRVGARWPRTHGVEVLADAEALWQLGR